MSKKFDFGNELQGLGHIAVQELIKTDYWPGAFLTELAGMVRSIITADYTTR